MCIIFVAGDNMELDITRIKNGIDEILEINEVITIPKEKLQGTDILDIEEVSVIGDIIKNNLDGYDINLNIKGIMTLPCSLTLKPVKYPFEVFIDGDIEELYTEIGENYKKTQNSIDIFPIIWENILMEIPIKVTSDDISDMPTSGDGWRLVTEEESRTNPELEKLKDLL